jgi:DNA-binding NtrC family response regulator
LFEEAQGGTIFLDEISSTSLDFQVKLLRVLQEGRMRRLGSNREIALDVRVIAASNKRIDDEIRAGNFREDLYFRLKGAEIVLPPLTQRPKDILPLARHFGDSAARKLNKIIHFSDAVVSALGRYSWPGNVRELESVVDYAVPRCNGTVLLSDLPESLREAVGEPRPTSPLVSRIADVKPLPQLNHEYALAVLALCDGNKTEAARLLGCNRKWLIKVEKHEAAGEYCDPRSYALFGKARSVGADDGLCPQCGSKQPVVDIVSSEMEDSAVELAVS